MRIDTKSKLKPQFRTLAIVALAIMFVAAGLGWYVYNKSKPTNEVLYGSDSTKPSSNTPAAASDNTGSISNSKVTQTENASAPIGETVKPRVPTGVFVSHHRPNLSGSPIANTLSSTCSTTPGAWCTVQFTKDGVSKQLPEKQTDSEGNSYWDWKLQDIELTAGTWLVSAVARNNNLTSTANDAVPLTVEQ